MREIAPDVWQIPLVPRDGINAYLVGDVLVDAGLKQLGGRVLSAVAGRTVSAHALTHAHLDHAGGSRQVLETLGIPCWAPAGDADDVERGRAASPRSWARRLMDLQAGFPAVPVARRIADGDALAAGFVAVATPGHTAGHTSYWRAADRVLICGDAFYDMHLLTLRHGLWSLPGAFNVDPALYRDSQRRLAELRPAVALFGHGPPLRDPEALARFAAE